MNPIQSKSQKAARRIRIGALLLGLFILLTGVWLSRKTHYRPVMKDEGWFMEEQQVLDATINTLEKEWENALREAALLESDCRPEIRGAAAREIYGVRQVSYFDSGKTHHEVVEFPLRGSPPQRLSLHKKEGGFLISDSVVFSAPEGQWIEEQGRPLFYGLSSSRSHAVVFTLRIEDALPIVSEATMTALHLLPRIVPSGAYREIIGPSQNTLLQGGDPERAAEASDEVIRLFSRFGPWTLRYWRPRVRVVTYDTGLLVGASFLALALGAAGWWIAREQEQAIKLAEERVSFVNSVSHELRTPLTNILLSSDLLEDELTSAKSKERLSLIKTESERLSRMVENVLSFARSERDKLEPPPAEEVNLPSFLEGCVSQFSTSFQRKNINLNYEIGGAETIVFSKDFVAQIIFNLLSNIQKYANEGANAWIAIESGDALVIRIANSGSPIPRNSRKLIFQDFERLDNEVTSGTNGSGLGLSISRTLAESLGGTLILEDSTQDTIFRLTLPL